MPAVTTTAGGPRCCSCRSSENRYCLQPLWRCEQHAAMLVQQRRAQRAQWHRLNHQVYCLPDLRFPSHVLAKQLSEQFLRGDRMMQLVNPACRGDAQSILQQNYRMLNELMCSYQSVFCPDHLSGRYA